MLCCHHATADIYRNLAHHMMWNFRSLTAAICEPVSALNTKKKSLKLQAWRSNCLKREETVVFLWISPKVSEHCDFMIDKNNLMDVSYTETNDCKNESEIIFYA